LSVYVCLLYPPSVGDASDFEGRIAI
jgi:hypothetical protein